MLVNLRNYQVQRTFPKKNKNTAATLPILIPSHVVRYTFPSKSQVKNKVYPNKKRAVHKPWKELGTPHNHRHKLGEINKSNIGSRKYISDKKLTVQNISQPSGNIASTKTGAKNIGNIACTKSGGACASNRSTISKSSGNISITKSVRGSDGNTSTVSKSKVPKNKRSVLNT